MLTWRLERAAIGDGLWFVAVRPQGVCVIAPPGVLVTIDERQHELNVGVDGWRVATWARTAWCDWPLIDVQPPDSLGEIDTCSVLRMLGDDWRNEVWNLLFAQLQDARSFGVAASGHLVPEDLARSGAFSDKWLTATLAAAFPERAHHLGWPICTVEPEPVPDYPDELFLRIDGESRADPEEHSPGQGRCDDQTTGRVAVSDITRDASGCSLLQAGESAIMALAATGAIDWLERWLRERLRDRPTARRVAQLVYTPIRKTDERCEARRQASIADSVELSMPQ